jgi:hypothetical protein
MSAHKMERGWRDIPYLLLKRGQYVKDQPELIGEGRSTTGTRTEVTKRERSP